MFIYVTLCSMNAISCMTEQRWNSGYISCYFFSWIFLFTKFKKKMWIRFITFPLWSRLYLCHTFSHKSLKTSRTRTALLEQSLSFLFGLLSPASPLFFWKFPSFNRWFLSASLSLPLSFLSPLNWLCHNYHHHHVCMCAKLLQLYQSVCKPMNYSLSGSSVHGILQERILEWVAMPSA